MSIEQVRNYFKKWGQEDRILEFSVSSATVELAAQAIGCAPAHIAKSIALHGPEGPLLVVASGDAKIDNSKYKQTFGVKATMLSAPEVEPLIGHQVGGVCPFALREGVSVYLDRSLQRFSTVFPACGSSNSVIELTLSELQEYSGCLKWVDVCKGWVL